MPHMLWHGASVHNGHLRGYDTHTYCRAFGSGAVTTWSYDLGLLRLGFKHFTFRLLGECPNQLSHYCHSMSFCYIGIIFLLEKDAALPLTKLISPSPKDALCQVWLKLAQRFWRRFVSMYFYYYVIFPLEKDVDLHLNKFVYSSPRDALCQVRLKLVQQFLRRRFFKRVDTFLLYIFLIPLEKDIALHSKKFGSPSPKDALCQVCLKLAWWFWTRRWKCEKWTVRWTPDRLTIDNRWSEKITWPFRSGELKTNEFDFTVKDKGHTEVISVHDTLSHGDTPMFQIW